MTRRDGRQDEVRISGNHAMQCDYMPPAAETRQEDTSTLRVCYSHNTGEDAVPILLCHATTCAFPFPTLFTGSSVEVQSISYTCRKRMQTAVVWTE